MEKLVEHTVRLWVAHFRYLCSLVEHFPQNQQVKKIGKSPAFFPGCVLVTLSQNDVRNKDMVCVIPHKDLFFCKSQYDKVFPNSDPSKSIYKMLNKTLHQN